MMDKTKAFISFSSRIHGTEKEPTAQVYKRTHKATKTSNRMIPRIKNMVHNERTWSASWSRICSPSTQLFCLCLQPSPPSADPLFFSFSLLLFFFSVFLSKPPLASFHPSHLPPRSSPLESVGRGTTKKKNNNNSPPRKLLSSGGGLHKALWNFIPSKSSVHVR